MNRTDFSLLALFAEAVDVLSLLAYMILQICCAVLYSVSVYTVVVNLAVAILVYTALSVLGFYPEYINALTKEACSGRVRADSLRMIRSVKMIFTVGLLIPCIFDVLDMQVSLVYNAALILLLIADAVFFEVRILLELQQRNNKDK